jgi:hypothetical protein
VTTHPVDYFRTKHFRGFPDIYWGRKTYPMKNKPTKPVRDPVVTKLISTLKKQGVRCGFGDQITQIRKSK